VSCVLYTKAVARSSLRYIGFLIFFFRGQLGKFLVSMPMHVTEVSAFIRGRVEMLWYLASSGNYFKCLTFFVAAVYNIALNF